jgi:MSHA biogenesis protein MshK
MTRLIFRLLVCGLPVCGALMAPAQAQLSDPTRPPGAVAGGDPAAPAAGSLLQSVKISPTERSAIIGGEMVKLNGKYGDARVIRITESEVVLRTASGTETLRMYPDISMKPVVEPAPAKAGKPASRAAKPAAKQQGKQE